MVKLKHVLTILLCTYATWCRGQDWQETTTEAPENSSQYFELLEQYKHHPLNLNSCELNDLQLFQFLSKNAAKSIIEHRIKFGPFINELELQQCALTYDELQLLLQFVYVRTGSSTESNIIFKHTLVATVQRQYPTKTGFNKDPGFLGNQFRNILRYRGTITPSLMLSYTGEKDIGESFGFSDKQKGFDYNSFSIELREVGGFDKIIIGDYSCDFGQGLTIGSGMRMGKSVLTLNSIKPAFGIKRYTSLNENLFNRGLAVTGSRNGVEYSFWYHRKKADGNLQEVNENEVLSSYQTSGLHRTQAELDDKNGVLTNQLGFNLKKTYKSLSIALTCVKHNQDAVYSLTTQPYQRFNYRDKGFVKTGLGYQYPKSNALFFGETTVCSNKSVGSIHGVLVSLSKQLGLSVLYRSFSRKYIPDLSVAFSETSKPKNEKGIYVGSTYTLNRHASASFYVDRYWFPWLTFGTNTSSNGADYLVYFRYRQSKKFSWTVRLKHEVKETHRKVDLPIKKLIEVQATKLRINCVLDPSKTYGMITRFEMTRAHDNIDPTWGYMLYQDLRFTLYRSKLKVYFRMATANIDTYANRIYTYENDVAYSYSLPFYQDNQVRSYVLIRFKILNNTDLWFKMAMDYKTGLKGFGSGLDSVSSPRRTDIKFQIRIRL